MTLHISTMLWPKFCADGRRICQSSIKFVGRRIFQTESNIDCQTSALEKFNWIQTDITKFKAKEFSDNDAYANVFVTELQNYFATPLQGRADVAAQSIAKHEVTCIAWWSEYGLKWPALKKAALALLTGVASTGSAERNWKSHSVVLSKFRQRLSTGKLHQLVYTYHNKRLLWLPR